ncbi:LacI family DNA-binding transcriptional regulator [Pelagicoccus sp. SDUM812005]|uniref:LacI family DNA-binding transcriptional regulator n=1 Tax=Pelagicoccus sp. SDUM812005 TaxID=3041257 RepID=UPI00280DAEE8|nr:LacI family DNA-binding transcriptional regulator [Pelagicoccus sp. SDUM812005]MDQ8181631.1 LacI family DNA-binding transcriptional regulator [Pelagicoccus sp. SDUM812005]
MEDQRPSLRDIARRLNVSHATVSMALRNNPRISEKRRIEVRRVAEEIGYRPDPMLSSLVAYRQRKQEKPVVSTIAWVNRWPDPRQLRRYSEFDEYWKGAEKAAEELGYKLEEFVVNEELRGHRLNDILQARGIQGIMIPPHASNDTWHDLGIEWDKFSVVRFGFSIADIRAHMIGCDQMRSAELAVSKISEAGYRSIGFITNKPFDTKTGGNFRMGFLRATEMTPGLRAIAPLVLDNPVPVEGGTKEIGAKVAAWIEENEVDAIFTSEIGLAVTLKKQGIRIPEDIPVASSSVTERFGIDAGIDQNPFEIGRVAVHVLVGHLNRNDRGEPDHCRRVLVEANWVPGSSLPVKAEAASKA